MPNLKSFIVLLVSVLLASSCASSGPDETSTPATAAEPVFEQLSPETSGLDFVNAVDENWQTNIMLNPYIYNGGGVAVIDYDGDGLEDLYFTATTGSNQLYRNLGEWRFENVTQAAGVAATLGVKTGVSVCDVNADGKPDLYVCRTGSVAGPNRVNLLYVNQGDGTFREQAKEFGLADGSASNHANFFDFDGDGDLDVYVLNNPVEWTRVTSVTAQPKAGGGYERSTAPWTEFDTDRLYENRDGRFVDVTLDKGMRNRAWGLSVTATDFNADGHDDLYVGNDYIEPDQLYIGDGRGGFADKAKELLRHTSEHTMGVDIADVDGDGAPDIVSADMLAPDLQRRKQLVTTMVQTRFKNLEEYGYGRQLMRNQLQLNRGDHFAEVAELHGVHATDWSWAPLLADFDLDGRRDLFVANGYRRDITDLDYLIYTTDSVQRRGGITDANFKSFSEYAALMPTAPLQNALYLRNSEGGFVERSTDAGLGKASYSAGCAYADLDRDGDLDLVVSNIDEPAGLFRNITQERQPRPYLSLELKGSDQNIDAIGAVVRVVAAGQSYVGEVRRTRGFLSAVTPRLLFGFETGIQRVDSLIVRFPDGRGLIRTDVNLPQSLVISAADSDRDVSPSRVWARSQLAESVASMADARAAGLDFVHDEDAFDDFSREPLLPYRLSHEGPCLAVGDIDGDGLDDLFVGGAQGQAGRVFRQTAAGRFAAWTGADAALQRDTAFEDNAATWIDVDGDRDLDLYVVSGGNSSASNSPLYRDRLYRQDAGVLQAAEYSTARALVPGSSVVAHDPDSDGDLDLFVGSLNLPGRYPETAASAWLRNDGGKFSNANAAWLPDSMGLGSVSDAALSDVDQDGRSEIVLVGHWSAPRVLKQAGERWEVAALPGAPGAGWYGSVASDGKKLMFGNFGSNHRYPTPLYLFAQDYDKNGQIDPIMAIEWRGELTTILSRDPLLKQLPSLKKKFVRYRDYSNASLGQTLPSGTSPEDTRFKVDQWASSMYDVQSGKYALLPLAAQHSVVRAGLALPDGRWLLAGNDRHVDAETGSLDAGSGILLGADGSVLASDLGLDGDVRALALVATLPDAYLVVAANNDGPLQLLKVARIGLQ